MRGPLHMPPAELDRIITEAVDEYMQEVRTLAYSNGPVEAQVGKLKLVKRSMFGRAKLPLLRQRLRNRI